MEIVENCSWCNNILYYKSLLLLECIKLMERPKKETVYNSLGRREYVLMGEGSLENPVHEKEDLLI